MKYFGVANLDIKLLNKHIFLPHMKNDVYKICDKCLISTCKKAKSKVIYHDFRT